MIVYLDTSVVLSRFLGQANALSSWGDWKQAFTSVLTRVEFLRTVDRLRLAVQIDDPERVVLHRQFNLLWEATHRIPLSTAILARAADSFPIVLGTLDALHLASALAVHSSHDEPLTGCNGGTGAARRIGAPHAARKQRLTRGELRALAPELRI